jgi:hypothetical protein
VAANKVIIISAAAKATVRLEQPSLEFKRAEIMVGWQVRKACQTLLARQQLSQLCSGYLAVQEQRTD